ncbi:UNVERIFIED_CONTAM: hypothetical protein FKN15_056915 [Acipenser sinensis]
MDCDGMDDVISKASCLNLVDNYKKAQKNERESIRQKLALGSFFDDGPGIYTSCSKSGKPSLSSRCKIDSTVNVKNSPGTLGNLGKLVASWLLLGCVGNPIFKVDIDKCINFSKELLDSVNATLSSEEISEGFNCTSELMNDITKATTVTACEPDYSSKDSCLRNITEDLLQYKAEFSKYQLSEHLDKTLSTIDALIEVLSSPDRKAIFRQKTELTFPDRMKLCEILQAFRVRTVTINRVMNYMKSRVSR